jgi:hypothetical protein
MVQDACPVGKGSPRSGQMGRLPRAPSRGVLATRRRRWERGESVGLSGSLPSLSRLFKRWAPGSGPLGCLSGLSGPLWASGARGSCAGDPQAAAVFPCFTPALEFTILGAVCGADVEGTNVDRPRSGGFQDQARMGLFVLPCGVLRASGACGSALGSHGRPLCFPWSVPVPETCFSVELGLCPCSLRLRLEGLADGFCFSALWRADGSVQSPASLPHIHQVEGIYQVSFPCQGRYSPVTRPVTLEDDGGGVDGTKTVSSDRCSSGSGAVWVFCLASGGLLGVFWTPFVRRVFLRGAPGLPHAPCSRDVWRTPLKICYQSLRIRFSHI